MEQRAKKELVIKTVDENQGLSKDEIICILCKQLDMTEDELDTVICACLRERRIQEICVGDKAGLYIVGQSSSNQAFCGDQSPKTKLNVKPLIVMLLIGLAIAALFIYPVLAYFFVIALVVFCIFLWVFKN